jgi:hypothetical protein
MATETKWPLPSADDCELVENIASTSEFSDYVLTPLEKLLEDLALEWLVDDNLALAGLPQPQTVGKAPLSDAKAGRIWAVHRKYCGYREPARRTRREGTRRSA